MDTNYMVRETERSVSGRQKFNKSAIRLIVSGDVRKISVRICTEETTTMLFDMNLQQFVE